MKAASDSPHGRAWSYGRADMSARGLLTPSDGGPGMCLPWGKRYCETCRNYAPRGTRQAVKGWKCDACEGAGK